KADVRAELKRLTDKGFFTPKEAGGVYVDRLEEFVKSSFFERMLSSQDLRREQRFLARTDDLGLTEELKEYTGGEGFVQGIADCIFKEDDGWVLVDYKTDNFKTVDEMSKYSMQLKLYKAAFELLIGEKVKSSYIYSFKLGVGMEFDL
ncbi:MAG: PD-(D/E)XK nuclease family protein, partial [Ruminococcus sp.]|nr:PD-(D/E)XK nuclease family protein [Ruminococcus sp.]